MSGAPDTPRVLTIGHSNRDLDAFIALLRAHGVARLVDVRSMPRSRRHPHFDSAPLAAALTRAGIAYRHEPALGGLRTAHPDSPHTALSDPAMRGFADHMGTAAFDAALRRLIAEAAQATCVVMCAEADAARCHRGFIADALVARGVAVGHVRDPGPPRAHALRVGAVAGGGRVRYPGNPGLFDPPQRG